MNTFDKINALLKEQNKRQVDLCNYLGVGKNKYTDWKAGRIKSYTKYLPQIAEFFGVSVDELFNNDIPESIAACAEPFDRIDALLTQRGYKQTELTNYLNIPKATYTGWKTGRSRSYTKYIPQISEFFGVSTDYILGTEKDKTNDTRASGDDDSVELSEHEKKLIKAYRERPGIQPAVDRLLGIELEGYITLFEAASSDNDQPAKYIRMPVEHLEYLKSLPETDASLK